MIDLTEYIEQTKEGRTEYFPCPSCGSRKKSFGVTIKDGLVKYGCFKDSCGFRGAKELPADKEVLSSRLEGVQLRRESIPNSWTIPDNWLRGAANPDAYRLLEKYHCLDAYKNKLFSCRYDVAQERLAILIKDLEGKTVGAVARLVIPKKGQLKVLSYGNTSIPFRCGSSKTAILVEDCFSAIACTNYGLTGVALLGTNIKQEHWLYFQQYQKLYLALDRDARPKSVSLWQQLKVKGFPIERLDLMYDIKDKPEQLERLQHETYN